MTALSLGLENFRIRNASRVLVTSILGNISTESGFNLKVQPQRTINRNKM